MEKKPGYDSLEWHVAPGPGLINLFSFFFLDASSLDFSSGMERNRIPMTRPNRFPRTTAFEFSLGNGRRRFIAAAGKLSRFHARESVDELSNVARELIRRVAINAPGAVVTFDLADPCRPAIIDRERYECATRI
jgi:hypothetical protein